MEKGILFIVSGFAGAGKTTITQRLLKKHDCYKLSVSATTRQPRAGEVDGREYFFKTEEEFLKMIVNDEFLENAQYVGNRYGTPRKWVMEQLESGNDIMLEIDLQGALQVKKVMPEALLIFVLPPSVTELKARLSNRGSETPEQLQRRLARAKEESASIPLYDYILVNEDIEKSTELLHNIVQCEKMRVVRSTNLINSIISDL